MKGRGDELWCSYVRRHVEEDKAEEEEGKQTLGSLVERRSAKTWLISRRRAQSLSLSHLHKLA